MHSQGLIGVREPRSRDAIVKRALVLGAVAGPPVGMILVLPDLLSAGPDHDPMALSPLVGFVVGPFAFAWVGVACAIAAFLPWPLTAKLPTPVRYLAAAFGSAAAIAVLDVSLYDEPEPTWFAARVVVAAALTALVLAPTITSRRTAATGEPPA